MLHTTFKCCIRRFSVTYEILVLLTGVCIVLFFILITDNTVCPAGWFGKDGECYLMNIKSTKKFEAARESCFRKDSYMFNPMSSSSVWSLLESLTNISVLTHIDTLLTGIRPIFYQTTYVTADGIRICEYCLFYRTVLWYSCFFSIRYAWANSVEFLGIRPRMCIKDIL